MSTSALNILALGAHAADQELAAGMVLAMYAQAGHKVTILSLTAGERGHPTLDATQYREQKVAEANACAGILGASSVVWEYRDAELPDDDAIKLRVADFVRAVRPDVLITHWKHSIHRDHRRAHTIAMDARFLAGIKRLEREAPAHWVPKVFFSENWEDQEGFEPDTYVETTDVFELYCRALSHFELWDGGTGWPYSAYYQALARSRGCLGFGLRGQYAAAMMQPPEARVRRFPELPM